MANLLMSLFFAFNLLFIISSHGRVVQKDSSTAVISGKPVSLQASRNDTGQTNDDDVQGLITIVTLYSQLKEENEDPCTAPTWTWIECNSDARPRVIALDLSSKQLTGGIPIFSTMDALQKIDLSHNRFFGEVPSFLGTFKNLKELNIAYNLLSGFFPDSVACNKNLSIRAYSNGQLYVSTKCTGTGNIIDGVLVPITTDTPTATYSPTTYTYRKKSKVGTIAGSISGIFLLISIAAGIFAVFRHRAKTASAIAAANAAGNFHNDQKTYIPAQETPMNSRPANMSTQI